MNNREVERYIEHLQPKLVNLTTSIALLKDLNTNNLKVDNICLTPDQLCGAYIERLRRIQDAQEFINQDIDEIKKQIFEIIEE